jgi:hypothetical protein
MCFIATPSRLRPVVLTSNSLSSSIGIWRNGDIKNAFSFSFQSFHKGLGFILSYCIALGRSPATLSLSAKNVARRLSIFPLRCPSQTKRQMNKGYLKLSEADEPYCFASHAEEKKQPMPP